MRSVRLSRLISGIGLAPSQLQAVASDRGDGSPRSLWALVRKLSGRRTRGRRAAAVMRNLEGRALGSADEIATEWEQHFMGEFRHNGCFVPLEAEVCPVGFAALPPVASPLTVEEWSERQ